MVSSIRKCLLALTLLAYGSTCLALTEVELFTVDYPPYTIIDDQGSITGIDVDVTVAAFRAAGVSAKISTAPWKRIVKNLKYGRIAGTLSCSRRPDRESFIAFSDPTSEASQAMVFNSQKALPHNLSFEDLKQYRVTAVEGWGVEKELTRAGIEHSTVPDINSGINAVVFRDVDIFYNGYLTTLHQARVMGLSDRISARRFTDKGITPFHLCMSKSFPDSDILLQKFNQGLQQLRTSGEYEMIYERYLGPAERR